MTAPNYTELKDRILAHVGANKKNIVRIGTCMSYTDVSQKTIDSFAKAGYEFIRVNEKGIYMMRGKSWDCISYCSFQFGSK
jgi:hypothetical protein